MRDPLAAGDPIAERRYAYARAAAREGDWAAAIDVLEQTIELAPEWAAAWFALGEAKERLGDFEGARAALRETFRLDPRDLQGAGVRLALLGEGAPPAALPAAYVARLFDDYAPRFDAHLTRELDYRGPELIREGLDRCAPGRRFALGLDLGCGTGLAGAELRARVARLIGVDLSPGMIAEARRTGLYDALEVGEVVAFLEAQPSDCADLVVAADVFVYLGDLAPVFAAVGRVLTADGLCAFSLEAGADDGFRLAASMRFKHSLAHVGEALSGAGLEAIAIDGQSVRREAGREVPGLVGIVRSSKRARAGSPR